MEVSKRSVQFLQWALGITFLWFGVLKLFNVSPVLLVIQKAVPLFAQSQWFFFLLSVLEIAIGVSFLTNKFVRIFALLMIAHLLVATVSVIITQGFAPRFPILSLEGEFVIKNIILMAAGYILIIVHTKKKEEKS